MTVVIVRSMMIMINSGEFLSYWIAKPIDDVGTQPGGTRVGIAMPFTMLKDDDCHLPDT